MPGSRSPRLREGCGHEVRRRVPRRGAGARARGRDPRDGRAGPSLQGHGGVRRAHAHHLQVRRRRPAAGERGARARAGLPRLRHPDGPGRRRDRGRAGAERHLHLLRRHDARPRRHGTLLDAKAEGADIRMVYSPLDALRIAKQNPGPRGRLLRDRLRDDGALDRADAHARQGGGGRQLLLLLQPRHDRAAAARAARVARPPARRLHRPGPRLDRRRRAAVRVHPGRLRQAGRHPGLRAARPAAVGLHGARQLAEGRCEVENQYTRVVPYDGNPQALQGDGRGLRAAAALRVARPGVHLAQRAQALARLRGFDAELRYACPACASPTRRPASAARC